MKHDGYIGCSKDALTTVNGEADSSGIELSSGCYGLVSQSLLSDRRIGEES